MAERTIDLRLCPTRTSGVHALIEQWISPATCLERQRRSYHKCFTCRYRGLSAEARLAPAPMSAAPAKPAPQEAIAEGKRERAKVSQTV